MGKTFRRDRLMRLARAGRLVSTESYSFDDMCGTSRCDIELPVRVIETGRDWVDGYMHVREHDFTSSCGHASQEADGKVWLYVHSNSNYTFRILAEDEQPPEPIGQDDPRRRGKN
jgi:hypothetical protein